jgi:cyclophilin family peptidyl-prolyl cis-trans isomerase
MLRRTLTTACSTLVFLVAGATVSAAEEQTPPPAAPAPAAAPQPDKDAAAKPASTALPEAVRKTMRDAANPVVRMQTTLGDMTIELYRKEAPKTVDNFLAYVRKKHYDGTIFHRVMPTFMIQGGGYTKDMTEKPQAAAIQNESANGLSNVLGTIAMARTDAPHSATAQFFINVKNNASLDKSRASDGWGYCVFGKVIAGMDTVNQIKTVKTKPTDFSEGFPIVPVVIQSVTVLQ